MYTLHDTRLPAGRTIVGTYTRFRRLMEEAHALTQRPSISWADLVATEENTDKPAKTWWGISYVYPKVYRFDNSGAVRRVYENYLNCS